MSVVETLQKARDYLMEHGWIKKMLLNEQGQACARGAIIVTKGNSRFSDWWEKQRAEESYLVDVIQELFPERINDRDSSLKGDLVAFMNNHPDTTFNDVIAVFDEAIIKAKEDGV